MSEIGLTIDGLGVDYGGGEVVRGVDITVHRGEVLALIGPNGAGKTSTLWAAAGLVPSSRGSIRLGNVNISKFSADRRARAGLALVPEDRGLFPRLSVGDHLWIAAHHSPSGERLDRVFSLFPLLGSRRTTPAGALSGGEAQMLTIAMALLMRPTVLMIDELSFGLAPMVVKQLLSLCRTLVDEEGMGMIIVEQFVDLALNTADEAVVMSDGLVSLRGRASDLLQHRDALRDAYLGALEPTA